MTEVYVQNSSARKVNKTIKVLATKYNAESKNRIALLITSRSTKSSILFPIALGLS